MSAPATVEMVTVGHGSRGRHRVQAVTLPVADLFAVRCRACGADPSQRCRGPLGELKPSASHIARAREAQR